MSSIFGFAFQLRNISCHTLYNLPNLDHRTLLWGTRSIDKYLNFLLDKQPDYILGLGIFFGRVSPIIRIETICHTDTAVFPINPFLSPGKMSIYSDKIGNSYCNQVSSKIVKQIRLGNLCSKYCFLHIPKKMDLIPASAEISHLLDISDIR